MFKQDFEHKKWWYRCNACGAETEKREDHASAFGLEGWQVDGYTDVHICPPCQAAGKTPEQT